MGKAVSSTLAKWESLEVYLKESEIEIDNNLVENAIPIYSSWKVELVIFW
jgi:hypothetical protein